VLDALSTIDADLGRAIVGLTERRISGRIPANRDVYLASYGSRAVIVVTPVRALKRLRGVQLVPIGNGRCLIALEPPHSIAQLELEIHDVLAGNGVSDVERRTLETVIAILRGARSSRRVAPEPRTIIVLESRRHRRES
jgi:hypothetical protein